MKLNYSLDDMRLFWVVAQKGSFTKAAQTLSMPASTLSRRINHLEQSLQLRLLNRDAHRVTLTGTGRQYLERCGPLFSELEDVAGELFEEKREACGKLRISAPINLTHQWLGKTLNQFLLQYPKIKMDLTLSNNNIDIVDEYIDIAFRVGEPNRSEWIARPLEKLEFVLCACPQRREWHDISHPTQLDSLPLILSKPITTWQLFNSVTEEVVGYTPGSTIKLAVDDLNTAGQAVIDGLGIGLLPRFIAEPGIKNGILKQVSTIWLGCPRTVYMLYRDRNNQPHRLRLLIDFMLNNSCFSNP